MIKNKDTDKDFVVKIDIERMKKALGGKSFQVPQGLTREEIRNFIISCAKK